MKNSNTYLFKEESWENSGLASYHQKSKENLFFGKEWKRFYQTDEVLNVNQSYSLHLWGKHSSHIPLENLKKGTLLYQLASKHCPYTIESAIL